MEEPVDKVCPEHDEATTTPPSRKRYTLDQLLNYRDTLDLSAPPVGYNPALLKPVEPLNKEIPAMREGMKWNRSRSMGTWAGQPGAKGGGLPPFSRLVEGGEDTTNGQPRGRALRSAISWSEQQTGPTPIPDKGFGRRNSRSDGPGRWDNNKDEQLSRSAEKRGADRWGAYGHRDKDKPPKPMKEDDMIELEEPYTGHEPEWMHHRPSAENPERMKQHRQFAQDFEQERKMMREKIGREGRERNSERGENSMIMTDDEINEFKKQLEAEERGVQSVFTFDSLKEAMRSQGVSNLPPMPTSGMSTVDQIEKSLKAAANAQMSHPISDLERQKMELMRAAGQGGLPNPGSSMESANRLLSMLRGQARPPVFGSMQSPLQQHIGGFPVNLPQQQQGLFPVGNTHLEKFFAANPRASTNLGLAGYGQQPQVPTMNMAFPYMQQAGQFNQRPQPPNPLLQLIANQQVHTARQKQAHMLAQLQQAHQQSVMQNPDDKDEDNDGKRSDHLPMMGVLPGGQTQVPLPAFGLQGNIMARPATPGMFNPQAMNLQGGPGQTNLFPGALPHMNPIASLPNLLMQNGGGVGRPMASLTGMNLGVRPSMPSFMDERQMLNGQPNALQASLLAAQQGSGLNRFFGEQTGGPFSANPPTAPDHTLEELKNEAQ